MFLIDFIVILVSALILSIIAVWIGSKLENIKEKLMSSTTITLAIGFVLIFIIVYVAVTQGEKVTEYETTVKSKQTSIMVHEKNKKITEYVYYIVTSDEMEDKGNKFIVSRDLYEKLEIGDNIYYVRTINTAGICGYVTTDVVTINQR